MRRCLLLPVGGLTLFVCASDSPGAAQEAEEPSSEAPEEEGAATADVAPADVAPADVAPAEAAPAEVAPAEAGPDEAPSGSATEVTVAEASGDAPVAEPEDGESGPKLAVVLVGDPDERLRSWASRVEEALSPAFERPFDPMLRSALRGGLGDPEDGFAEVRRERRRLGLSEAEDVPVLVRLGRRAGAVAIAVVRRGAEGPELVVLDVRHASFFEGSLVLSDTSPARVRRFVGPRARSSSRGAAALPPVSAPAAATEPDPEGEGEEDEPDFFERYWPYGAALVLLGAFVAIIAATASTDGGDQPVLRFVPGGR
ncbi:MAG: hypothetical protein AB8I08_34675 [Sandaracinaceae bacterium]